MFMINHLVGFGANTPAAPLATRVFTDSEGHPAVSETTHTFTAKSLGTAASDRIIVIAGGNIVKKKNGVCFGACFQTGFDPATEDHAYTNLTKDAEVTADASGSGSVASEEVAADVTETITVVSDEIDGRHPLVAAHWEAA